MTQTKKDVIDLTSFSIPIKHKLISNSKIDIYIETYKNFSLCFLVGILKNSNFKYDQETMEKSFPYAVSNCSEGLKASIMILKGTNKSEVKIATEYLYAFLKSIELIEKEGSYGDE